MKKIVLWFSAVYAGCFVGAFLISEVICKAKWCRIHDDDFIGLTLIIFSPFIPVFLLSLITYKLREEVFRAWWNFARWFVPIIMLVTFLLNSTHRGGGISGAVAGSFNIFVVGVLYAIFVITSAAKIVIEQWKNILYKK